MDRFFIGIDPSAATYTASLFDAHERAIRERRSFEGSRTAPLEQWLNQHGLSREEALVCVEDTGVYSEALLYSLHENGFRVALIEPLRVWKAFGEGPKTDELDSGRVAEYGFRYADQLRLWQPSEVIVEQVRVLLSTREQLVTQRTAAQNTRQTLRRKVVQTPAATAVLDETIDYLKQQIEVLEEEIRRLINEHPTSSHMVGLLMTAPGVGLLLSAQLLVLTNGFKEEVGYRSLAQYLGICPNAYRSGKSVQRRSRSRGYGPSLARKLLHLAARSVSTHAAPFREYYRRKVSEGKPKPLVLNNVANKLLRLLCGMMRDQKPYIAGYRSSRPARGCKLLCV
jgi:transposase